MRLLLTLLLLAPLLSLHAAERPNLVVILCDDLGYGDLGCYGHPRIKTPRLDRMAEEGIRMTSFYSTAPVCSPSRVGLLTGRSPNRAGVYDWIPPAGPGTRKPDNRDLVHLQKGTPTIATLLKAAGYATCMSGKWHCNAHFNKPSQAQPGDAGFDHWFATQNNASPSHANPKNFVRNGEPVGPLEGYSCQLVVDEAIGWLSELNTQNQKLETGDSPQPFFLYVAYHEPHEPVASPKEMVEEYLPVAESRDQAEYFANVANVDSATGRLLDALDAAGVGENTLVVFTSDNGPETLDRYKSANRSHGTPAPLRGMKLWTTDAGFRVAGIARWPARITGGKVSDVPVSALDFLPTFCALAGAEPTPGRTFDGTDCLPALLGENLERKKPLLWCYYNAINERRVALRDGDWKVLARLVGPDGKNLPKAQNIHPGNAEQVKGATLTDVQIFRISDDIAEKADLSAAQPERAQELKAKLEAGYRELIEGSHVWER